MSQALLSAAALAAHTSMARILLREYGIGHHARPGIAGSCGGNWKQNVDKAIVRQTDMFPQSAIQTREQCDTLPDYVSWINPRIRQLGNDNYRPYLPFYFHSSLGNSLDNALDKVSDYL